MSARVSPEYYLTEAWIRLRDAIVERDGNCCRNCGFANRLEVHHWLPLPQYSALVDCRGYGQNENPLIVHESGLVTLCVECHAALTERRTRQAILKNPDSMKMASPEKAAGNIFEAWALNGKTTPFRVRKGSWNSNVRQFYVVEKIEITKWPYGKAWGRYVREDVSGELAKVPNAGIYDWHLCEES